MHEMVAALKDNNVAKFCSFTTKALEPSPGAPVDTWRRISIWSPSQAPQRSAAEGEMDYGAAVSLHPDAPSTAA